MSFNINDTLAGHVNSITVLGTRAQLLAGNLANTDTPGYNARDIDFKAILKEAADNQQLNPHAAQKINLNEQAIQYRVPMQPSEDGNTVDAHQEYVRFSDNAVRYQASMKLLGQEMHTLLLAIKGQ